MRGLSSDGMLLCASNKDHTEVDPLAPPEGCEVGTRVSFGGDLAAQLDPATPNQVQWPHNYKKLAHLLHTGFRSQGGIAEAPYKICYSLFWGSLANY